MAKTITPGLSGEASVLVTMDNTAAKMGGEATAAKVFATPMLVALMEQAAAGVLQPYLEPGESSVGTRIDIAHLAATPIGMTVRAVARLEEVAGKRMVFAVEAFDDREKVGEGRHERYIINMEKFASKLATKK